MLTRTFQFLLVAGLVTGTLQAANDPFVGKWKVNPSKSKLNDEMKVEVAAQTDTPSPLPPAQSTQS